MAKNDNLERSARNYNAHFTRANLFVGLANNTEQGLSNTLFLIATIFLGLTSPLVSDVQSLSEGHKVILFISWVFTIVSILAGLIQIAINLKFFEWHFKLSNKQESIWSEMPSTNQEFDEAVKKSDAEMAESPIQTTFIPLTVQAVTMVIAIILAMTVGGLALFKADSSCVTQTHNMRHMIGEDSNKAHYTPRAQSKGYYEIRRCR